MNSGELVVWGTCWYDESPDVIANSLALATYTLDGLKVAHKPIIFDARHDRDETVRQEVTNSTGVELISHQVDAYPNKNFGVAALAEVAELANADYLVVADPDWVLENYELFVRGLLGPLFGRQAVGVIPDIGKWAGRANRLVGSTAMKLFRRDMESVIRTPFAGAFAASVEAITRITRAPSYHFDWGGEWDIAAGLSSLGSVQSPYLGMKNVRHRSSSSKAGDGFQIWRAVLTSSQQARVPPGVEKAVQYASLKLEDDTLVEAVKGRASEQLARLVDGRANLGPHAKTVAQLVPMVIAPLALLLDGYDCRDIELPLDDSCAPYDRDALKWVEDLAIASASEALSRCGPWLHFEAPSVGGPLGEWTDGLYAMARDVLAGIK